MATIPKHPWMRWLRSTMMALFSATYLVCLGLTVWLYLNPQGDHIPLLLLELGPRWLLIAGFLPLLAMPISLARRAAAAIVATLASIALLDVRVSGCFAPQSEQGPIALRVGSYNTGGGFVAPTALLLWYDEQRLDVLLLQEMGKPERLGEVAESLGMKLECASKLCALTQHRISGDLAMNRRDLGGWGGYAANFTLCGRGSCWPLVNIHLATPRHAIEEVLGRQPWPKAHWMLGVRELESSLAALVTDAPQAIVSGDFNMTQQSPLYRKHWSDWQNAFGEAGCGLGYTKLTRRFGTRIDHILAGGRWKVLSASVHEGLGGDHRPLTATLVMN